MNYTLEDSFSFESLYESMLKCKKGKLWKASVARFHLHGVEEVLKLEEKLNNGTYTPKKPHTFTLTYPKVRVCSSMHISDRVVQRSLNDKILYPEMTRGFVYDNTACQKGKGTTLAMDRLNKFMRREYINNSNSVKGLYVLQADIHGYYRHMKHDLARACFEKNLSKDVVDKAMEWIAWQYPYDIGFEPGSQMVQILGISFLNPLDHFIKEHLRAKSYGRTMDDFYIISRDKQYLEMCMSQIINELAKIGLTINEKKTRIYPIEDGIPILGFTFKLTDTGKVLRFINPNNVKHQRKKLFHMAQLLADGQISYKKFMDGYEAWKAHAMLGNSYNLILRMDEYVESLLEVIPHYENNS